MSHPKKNTLEAFCSRCKSPTQHQVLRSQKETGSTEDVSWYAVEHQIIQCMGCQNICFRQSTRSSEDTDVDGQPEEYVVIYPVPAKREAQVDLWKLPRERPSAIRGDAGMYEFQRRDTRGGWLASRR